MHPEILAFGPVHLRSYGFMMAVAFLVGTWLSLREARRLGLDEDRLVNVILITLMASILGARLLYVMEHLQEFRRQWGSILAVWQGGLTLYGGIVAGVFAGLVSAHRSGLPRWVVADALTPALALGTVFGRLGCFLNGCCYGAPTALPFGVVFPRDSFAWLEYGDVPVHPSQLYNAFTGMVLFAVVWVARRRVRTPGVLLWLFLLLFALVRIPVDMTRTWEREALLTRIGGFGITESQLTSIAIALFSALMILRLRRTAPGESHRP
jgi:phosphatidylglycerol:prolipoprotein diacylglycerol transferase